ncbi:MAG: sugar diacid recognition domain-containing protein [Candidatus Limivivens sp.]|nr:sugar diacid recognition domain-containing protein [Candidatus Limivivens sp.]
MIDRFLAERFVKKAGNYTTYNINIMNENGIIIASSDAMRVGSFHEIAYQLLKADKDVVEVVGADHFQGGRTGINMALLLKKKKIGVLGITGEPEEIRDIAKVIKMSLETMLEYEEQNKKFYHQQNLRTRFVDGILYQEDADSDGELTAISEQLGYRADVTRIPVILETDKGIDMYHLIEILKRDNMLRGQDIYTVTRDNNILIYRKFEEDQFYAYKSEMENYLEGVELYLEKMDLRVRFFVGSFQNKYCYYRNGFQHARWLQHNLQTESGTVFHFYDYVGDYMRSIAPVYELNRIYSAVCPEMDEKKVRSIIELVESLRRNNYNFNSASKELFVHKNTLIFRYNKIKEMFNVNPIQKTSDKDFLDWLILYLKMNR